MGLLTMFEIRHFLRPVKGRPTVLSMAALLAVARRPCLSTPPVRLAGGNRTEIRAVLYIFCRDASYCIYGKTFLAGS